MKTKTPKEPEFVLKQSTFGGVVRARRISLWVYADGDAMVAEIPDIGVKARESSRDDAITVAIHEMNIKVNAAKNANQPVPWVDVKRDPPRGCERRTLAVS